MKRNVYLLFFAVICLTVRPQKYQPLDSTLVWSTETWGKVGSSNCMMTTYSRYYMKGYIMNNGRIWNKLYWSGYSSMSGYCGNMTANPPFYNALSGYVYNDSLNRLVYYVTSLPPNYTPVMSDILYDFNKSVGDTIFNNHSSFKLKIVSIDSLLFSNKYYKKYHTSVIDGPSDDITIVEGIGSSCGPVSPPYFFESGSRLLCFASPSQTMTITNYSIYKNGYCEGIFIGIDESESHSIQNIYPNPFHNSLIVDFPAVEITIYDGLGRPVLEKKTSNGKNYLETEHLSPGIYFLKAGGFTRKIIKQ